MRMFRTLGFLGEAEVLVSLPGTYNFSISLKPNKEYTINIIRIVVGWRGVNLIIKDSNNNLIDVINENYITEKIYMIDKHYVNEILTSSKADNTGNTSVLKIEYSPRNDSTDITDKKFFIAIWGETFEEL
jgi:hypothetical protein